MSNEVVQSKKLSAITASNFNQGLAYLHIVQHPKFKHAKRLFKQALTDGVKEHYKDVIQVLIVDVKTKFKL